jgi:DNA adenine methylase
VFDRYIEPFLGSGAIFFHLRLRRTILSDINAELIELFGVIRDEPAALMALKVQKYEAGGLDEDTCGSQPAAGV